MLTSYKKNISLFCCQQRKVELWGNESELAKLNFDLQNTELSKLPEQKEVIGGFNMQKVCH